MTFANLPSPDIVIGPPRGRTGRRAIRAIGRVGPGVVLCGAVTLAACGLAAFEEHVFGRAWLEALVLAIVLGTAVRSLWTPGDRFGDGIAFSAKTLLEVAVMLLGAAISVRTLAAAGPGLLFGIGAVVATAILVSLLVCRCLGLPRRMAILIACGNSICGNSAIAAVAPVIGADSEDVAASIAFTAVLGVVVVLGLPLLVPLLGCSVTQFGIFAGLTVYAVPQIIAATAPVGTAAVQLGTLVKLVRVLMLGPVVLVLSLLAARLRETPHADDSAVKAGERSAVALPGLHKVVPWFIVGFLALATLHSLDLISGRVLAPMAGAANVLTILSMAALGLGVDVKVVAKAGGRVALAVVGSLLGLGALSFGLIRLLGLA